MQLNVAICLYRALLRECRHQFHRYDLQAINIRAPITSTPGDFKSNAAAGAAYQLETLQALIPGLAVLPQEQQLPLALLSIKQLIKDNFKANRGHVQQSPHSSSSSSSSQPLGALDQGFAALRTLPQQAYMEACSSKSETDGVTIEATSCFSPLDTVSHQGEHWFRYRVRITNMRQHPIKVLGRGWVINNHLGELEGYVMLSPENGIVGQKPTIPPGSCFEYVSCTPLRSATGPGQMKGQLMIDFMGPAETSDEDDKHAELIEIERVSMPVAPFKLQTTEVAMADVAEGRSRDDRQQQ